MEINGVFMTALEDKYNTLIQQNKPNFWKVPRELGTDVFVSCDSEDEFKQKFFELNIKYNKVLFMTKYLRDVVEDPPTTLECEKEFNSEDDLETWVLKETENIAVISTKPSPTRNEHSGRYILDDLAKRCGIVLQDHDCDEIMTSIKAAQLFAPTHQDYLNLLLRQVTYIKYILHLPVFDDWLFHGLRFDVSNYVMQTASDSIWNLNTAKYIEAYPFVNCKSSHDFKWSLGKTVDNEIIPVLFSRDDNRKFVGSKASLLHVDINQILPTEQADKEQIVWALLKFLTFSNFNVSTLTFLTWEQNYIMEELLSSINATKDDLRRKFYPTSEDAQLWALFAVSFTDLVFMPTFETETDVKITHVLDSDDPIDIVCTAVDLPVFKLLAQTILNCTAHSTGVNPKNGLYVNNSVDVNMSWDIFDGAIRDRAFVNTIPTVTPNVLKRNTDTVWIHNDLSVTLNTSLFRAIASLFEYKFLLESYSGTVSVMSVTNNDNVNHICFYITSKDQEKNWFINGMGIVFTEVHDRNVLLQRSYHKYKTANLL